MNRGVPFVKTSDTLFSLSVTREISEQLINQCEADHPSQAPAAVPFQGFYSYLTNFTSVHHTQRQCLPLHLKFQAHS